MDGARGPEGSLEFSVGWDGRGSTLRSGRSLDVVEYLLPALRERRDRTRTDRTGLVVEVTLSGGDAFAGLVVDDFEPYPLGFGHAVQVHRDVGVDEAETVVAGIRKRAREIGRKSNALPRRQLETADQLDSEFATDGVTVSAVNTGGGPNLAIIFNSAAPTGGDADLGTPNTDFGGPGVGAGGGSAGGGPNTTALYNVLIVAENSTDANMDNLIDTPDDEAGGGMITFTFAQPSSVVSVDLLDIEEASGAVTTRASGGGLISSIAMSSLGDNSFQSLTVEDSGVSSLEVEFSASGAVAQVVYCPPLPTPTATATHTFTAVATDTPTAEPTSTSTATAVATDTPTAEPTSTSTSTATAVATDTPTAEPTSTSTSTATAVATDTPTAEPTSTSTSTATAVATDTPTAEPTSTSTSTATAVATDTPTAEPTSTSTSTATAVATDTTTPADTSTATATTTATMAPTLCGNGVVNAGEQCDDGNAFDNDGCDTDCAISSQCTFAHGGVPSEVFVNDGLLNDGGVAPAGCAAAAFATIQSAIASGSVVDGDLISVCPGSYAESVIVTKEVSIRSTNGAAVTTVTSAGVAFDVRRSAVTIEGLTIAATISGVEANSICPIGASSCTAPGAGSNLTVTGNVIDGAPLGIGWLRKIDCAAITGNSMTGNSAHIDLSQQEGARSVLVSIESNLISAGGGGGVAVRSSGNQPRIGFAYRFETEFARRLVTGGGKIRFEPDASIRHLKAERGGTRSAGGHMTSPSPLHGVGRLLFRASPRTIRGRTDVPGSPPVPRGVQHVFTPDILVDPNQTRRRMRALLMALRLGMTGPRYVQQP